MRSYMCVHVCCICARPRWHVRMRMRIRMRLRLVIELVSDLEYLSLTVLLLMPFRI